MTIDRDLVTRKLTLIFGELRTIEKLAATAQDEFLRDEMAQAVAERVLERVIGRMIDVNYHLLTGRGLPPPSDYFTSFLKLAEIGVLDRAFADRLAPSAGLRNRLVHEYDAIDPARVFDALRRSADDIRRYAAAVQDSLDA
jgi:uncharacterized protein YutE (UPF0331/DUF86 family)